MTSEKWPSQMWKRTACSKGRFTSRRNGEFRETGMNKSAMGRYQARPVHVPTRPTLIIHRSMPGCIVVWSTISSIGIKGLKKIHRVANATDVIARRSIPVSTPSGVRTRMGCDHMPPLILRHTRFHFGTTFTFASLHSLKLIQNIQKMSNMTIFQKHVIRVKFKHDIVNY